MTGARETLSTLAPWVSPPTSGEATSAWQSGNRVERRQTSAAAEGGDARVDERRRLAWLGRNSTTVTREFPTAPRGCKGWLQPRTPPRTGTAQSQSHTCLGPLVVRLASQTTTGLPICHGKVAQSSGATGQCQSSSSTNCDVTPGAASAVGEWVTGSSLVQFTVPGLPVVARRLPCHVRAVRWPCPVDG